MMRRLPIAGTLATGIIAAAMLAVSPAPRAAEFRFAYQADVQNMDPLTRRDSFTANFVMNIMEPLVRRNRALQIEGALATGWKLVSPTTWQFTLRPGVTFSNGYAFGADDVVTTFRLGSDPKSFFRTAIANILAIRKVDDLTIEVDTKGAYPLLLNDLSNMPIFSARWLAEHNVTGPVDPSKDQDSYTLHNALGTGPFRLVEFLPGQKIVLDENPGWWDRANKQHNLTRVEFYPITQPAARVAALLSGQVDLILPAPLQDLIRISENTALKVVESPELRTLHIGMEIARPELRDSAVKGRNPFSDLRVRQAVYQAIDIDTLVAKIMSGHAVAVSTIMSPRLGGYTLALDGRLLPYDVAAAKQKLADAGYADGFDVSFDCPNDRYVNDAQICTAISAMLARVGIKVRPVLQPGARFFPKVEQSQSDMWLMGWAANTTLDAHNFVQQIMVTPDGARGSYNPGRYSNARIDALEPQIAAETDSAKRQAMITEAFSLHKAEIGHIPLHAQTNVWAMKRNVEVLQPASGDFWLRYVMVN